MTVDRKRVASGLLDALEQVDRESRSSSPALFVKVDRIKRASSWKPWWHRMGGGAGIRQRNPPGRRARGRTWQIASYMHAYGKLLPD